MFVGGMLGGDEGAVRERRCVRERERERERWVGGRQAPLITSLRCRAESASETARMRRGFWISFFFSGPIFSRGVVVRGAWRGEIAFTEFNDW